MAVPFKMFGAKADGQADDTDAIEKFLRRAIADLFDARANAFIELPPGTYKITKPIRLKRPR